MTRAEPSSAPSAAILYLHGGGLLNSDMENFSKSGASLAADTGLPVFMLKYRVAPENPHPAPAEDAYAGFKFLLDNAARFDFDPARIALLGESAGACFCAAVCLVSLVLFGAQRSSIVQIPSFWVLGRSFFGGGQDSSFSSSTTISALGFVVSCQNTLIIL